MKKLLFTLALMAVCFMANAQRDYSSLYTADLPIKLKQVKAPKIPERSVKLTDYGAKGNGVDICTEAFRTAIDELSRKGGGHLIVPAGVWLTGPISLKSNIDLHLEANALVIFSPNKSLYFSGENKSRYLPLIGADRVHDISITGSGTLDGNGKYWRPAKRNKNSDTEWKAFKRLGGYITPAGDLWMPYNLKNVKNITAIKTDTIKAATKEEGLRNDLIRITKSDNILIEGVTVQNSPRFHVHPIECTNVILDGISVRCPWNAQNGDAIDLAHVQTALVINCIVDAGDDGICLKAGDGDKGVADGPCSDMLIQDNTVYHAHGGFVFGSDCSGGMQKIVFRRCTMSGTDVGLRFKSGLGRGGKTSQIYCQDIVMNDIKDEAIIFDCTYIDKNYKTMLDKKAGIEKPKADGEKSEKKKAKEKAREAMFMANDFAPDFQDIHIERVVCRECRYGLKTEPLKGRKCISKIEVKDCTLFYTVKGEDIDPDSQINVQNTIYATY
ncbi:MAG: right-handed parallel beta-helix repeat-containing protein [Bacteroidales bacterium]|nr:right-handed parallel beta-helix repeat-containing protein [Bacteroidales bacterium]